MSGTLTHSPADVLRHLLVELGQGVLPSVGGDWPIYVGAEPNTPDSVVTLYDTAGRDDGRVMSDGERQEHHGVQIRLRDPDHQSGYLKARAVALALDQDIAQSEQTIAGTTYTVHAVSRTTDVISLGKEVPKSKRNLFTINVVVALRQN